MPAFRKHKKRFFLRVQIVFTDLSSIGNQIFRNIGLLMKPLIDKCLKLLGSVDFKALLGIDE